MGKTLSPYEEFEHLKQKAMKHYLSKIEQDRLCFLMQHQPVTKTTVLEYGSSFTFVSHPFFYIPIKQDDNGINLQEFNGYR